MPRSSERQLALITDSSTAKGTPNAHFTGVRKSTFSSGLIALAVTGLLVAIVLVCTAPPYKYRLTRPELARERFRNTATMAAFGLAFGAGLLAFATRSLGADGEKLPRPRQFSVGLLCSAGAFFAFFAWGPASHRGIHSTPSERNECLHNLKRIDGQNAWPREGTTR